MIKKHSENFKNPLILFFVYLCIHAILRVYLSDTYQLDDAEQIIRGQHFSLGYPTPQPPLYTWISWASFKIFGASLATLTLIKYSLIFITFIFIWKTGSLIFDQRKTNYLNFSAYLLMPSFAWHMHQGFTNTILLGLGISMTFYYLIKIMQDSELNNYIFLGISMAIGILGKYSFLIFLLLAFFSVIAISELRGKIQKKQLLVTLIVFVILISPHLTWLIDNFDLILVQIDKKLSISNSSIIMAKLLSLKDLFLALVGFITPLIFSILFFMNHIEKRDFSPHDIGYIFLQSFYKFFSLSLIVLIIFYSMPHFKVRWLHPIMMIFPFFIFVIIDKKYNFSDIASKRFIKSVIIFSLVILSIRIAQLTIGPEIGFYGRINRPIIESVKKINPSVFNNAAIKTDDHFLGTHLLSHFNQNQILIKDKIYRQHFDSSSCVILWDNDTNQKPPEIPHGSKVNSVSVTKGKITYELKFILQTNKC